jgi:hypothetical protein
MECLNGCRAPMQIVRVERLFQRAGRPVVIRELEMNACDECGAESMPLHSARIVEQVLNGELEPAGELCAPLFETVS